MFFLFSYFWGAAIFAFCGIFFITLESISAPPANGPGNYKRWLAIQSRKRPVLVCLGDSLTHGTCSSSITPEIPVKLCETLGMDPPNESATFADPLWVVNCGQNYITTFTILQERLNVALGSYPDYILILIGTNDVMGQLYNKTYGNYIVTINELPEPPNMQAFERNLKGILNFIQEASPTVKVGLCTLPPLGEDLSSASNQLVRQANEVIERAASSYGERCSLVPIFSNFETVIEKSKGKGLKLYYSLPVAFLLEPLLHLMPSIFSRNMVSKLFGNSLLSDGIHLNENGRDIVTELIVEWLVKGKYH